MKKIMTEQQLPAMKYALEYERNAYMEWRLKLVDACNGIVNRETVNAIVSLTAPTGGNGVWTSDNLVHGEPCGKEVNICAGQLEDCLEAFRKQLAIAYGLGLNPLPAIRKAIKKVGWTASHIGFNDYQSMTPMDGEWVFNLGNHAVSIYPL